MLPTLKTTVWRKLIFDFSLYYFNARASTAVFPNPIKNFERKRMNASCICWSYLVKYDIMKTSTDLKKVAITIHVFLFPYVREVWFSIKGAKWDEFYQRGIWSLVWYQWVRIGQLYCKRVDVCRCRRWKKACASWFLSWDIGKQVRIYSRSGLLQGDDLLMSAF